MAAGVSVHSGAEVGAFFGGVYGALAGAAIGAGIAAALTEKVSGLVVDHRCDPIVGACIQPIGYSGGTITDIEGRFSLRIKKGGEMKVSYIGFQTEVVRPSQTGVLIIMKEDC